MPRTARKHRPAIATAAAIARHAWDEGSADQVIDLLEQHRPKAEETEMRNFEWHYLYRLCHSELLTLKGHTQRARTVTYSPDGKRIASGSNDKTVRIWDSESGRHILIPRAHRTCEQRRFQS